LIFLQSGLEKLQAGPRIEPPTLDLSSQSVDYDLSTPVKQTEQIFHRKISLLFYSSPLKEEDEDGCSDLWDAASLDYPGNQSPLGWEFLGEEDDHDDPLFYEEPRFHTWHYWVLGVGASLALVGLKK